MKSNTEMFILRYSIYQEFSAPGPTLFRFYSQDLLITIIINFFRQTTFLFLSFFLFSIIGNTNTFNLRVKVEAPTGLLLWTGGDEMSPASDFLLLGLENGFLHFRFNLGNGEGGVIYNQSKIDDGKWHRIRASRYVGRESVNLVMYRVCTRNQGFG